MGRLRRMSLATKIAGIISAVIIFVGGAVINGIIGNRADAVFISVWSIIQTTIRLDPVPWSITVIAFIFCFFTGRHGIITHQALNRLNDVVNLDTTLLKLLPNLISVSSNEREEALRRTLVDLLLEGTRTFAGDVHRASILLPDSTGEHLKIWAHAEMPQGTVDTIQFYIGSDSLKRKREQGVAGEAFLKQEIIVIHVKKITTRAAKRQTTASSSRQQPGSNTYNEKHKYTIDKTSYLEFSDNRPFPPYSSFVCVPIVGSTSSSTTASSPCLGIVCFDSWNSIAFDSPAAQDLLQALGSRIASVLLIYRQF